MSPSKGLASGKGSEIGKFSASTTRPFSADLPPSKGDSSSAPSSSSSMASKTEAGPAAVTSGSTELSIEKSQLSEVSSLYSSSAADVRA